jgi:dTDP-4-amino-4,6-dideoxygalactose transaminase
MSTHAVVQDYQHSQPEPLARHILQPIIVPAMLRRLATTISTPLQLANIVLTRSGRSEFLLALHQPGTQPDDRVLLLTYHSRAERLAAVLVFYPITPRGGPDMDFPNALDGRPVRAILVAHLFGLPISLTEVRAFCSERGIGLIEDCAHCFFWRRRRHFCLRGWRFCNWQFADVSPGH